MNKGWYGNRYGHSLASKGIKTKQERIETGKNNEKKFKNFVKNLLDKENIMFYIDKHGQWIFVDSSKNSLLINMYIDLDGNIEQGGIYANPTGTGIGSKVMQIMKSYADTYDKHIHLNEVDNISFVMKLGGFERYYIDENDKIVYQDDWEHSYLYGDDDTWYDDHLYFVYNRSDF